MTSQKTILRQSLQNRVRQISPQDRSALSVQARSLLKRQPVWQRARIILFYAPLKDEVDIWPLVADALAEKKIAVLPQFNPKINHYVGCQITDLENDLAPGRFGIPEPKDHCAEILLNRLDLALVPGVGFDPMGRRLGRGKGFYDRLLAQISGTKCGVGFYEQIVETIPTEPHDVHLNCILTPTRWLPVPACAGFNEFFGP